MQSCQEDSFLKLSKLPVGKKYLCKGGVDKNVEGDFIHRSL